MKKSTIIGILLVLFSLTGCATMMSDKTQKVDFKTKPEGAEVVVGSKTCITPCTLELDKGKMFPQAILTKDGYQSQNITIQSKMDPLTYLNVLNLGFGMVVDYVYRHND